MHLSADEDLILYLDLRGFLLAPSLSFKSVSVSCSESVFVHCCLPHVPTFIPHIPVPKLLGVSLALLFAQAEKWQKVIPEGTEAGDGLQDQPSWKVQQDPCRMRSWNLSLCTYHLSRTQPVATQNHAWDLGSPAHVSQLQQLVPIWK